MCLLKKVLFIMLNLSTKIKMNIQSKPKTQKKKHRSKQISRFKKLIKTCFIKRDKQY